MIKNNKIFAIYKNMKKILSLIILSGLSFAKISYAFNGILPEEEVVAVSKPLQAYTLISAIVIAVVATIVVFRNAQKMKGGVFSIVLRYFGVGMIAILLSFIATSQYSFLSVDDADMVSNILFIIGYVSMAMAAVKMHKAICD